MTEPWNSDTSFHNWLLKRIKEIIGESPPKARVKGVMREIDEDDFGFGKRTISDWKKELPDTDFPDGKKMIDLIEEPGFQFFTSTEQDAIIRKWIEIELVVQDHNLSDELVGVVMKLVENSSPDFLGSCVNELTR